MSDEKATVSNEDAVMTKEEEATMLVELSHRLCNLTSEYVETVRKMFQTYPELRKAFDIVVAMDLFDHDAVRFIHCSNIMRDKLVVELQNL